MSHYPFCLGANTFSMLMVHYTLSLLMLLQVWSLLGTTGKFVINKKTYLAGNSLVYHVPLVSLKHFNFRQPNFTN